MAVDVSQRVIRYEGEGKTRRPVYLDEGPASAAIAHQIGEGKTALIDGLPARELDGGAGAIERRYLSEAERAVRAEVRPLRPTGPTQSERMQARRQHPIAERCACGVDIRSSSGLDADVQEAVQRHQIEPVHITWDLGNGIPLSAAQRHASTIDGDLAEPQLGGR